MHSWLALGVGLGLNVPARAAEKAPPVDVHEAFMKVRIEYEKGGVKALGDLVDEENWEKVLEFTKLYDLSFRKFLMKGAADGIIDDSARKKAKEIRNEVTFDLIAVNKAARPQYRSVAKAAAQDAMRVLRGDLETFLALEPPL